MEKVVLFKKDGYDPFIDFLKAYAIICVLMGHTFPFLQETGYALWYGMQVPIFILIQAFHVFKKDVVELNLKKIILRIFIPYFIILSAEYIILFIHGVSIKALIGSLLYGGGMGLDPISLGCISRWL
jgi:hypothetical protein